MKMGESSRDANLELIFDNFGLSFPENLIQDYQKPIPGLLFRKVAPFFIPDLILRKAFSQGSALLFLERKFKKWKCIPNLNIY